MTRFNRSLAAAIALALAGAGGAYSFAEGTAPTANAPAKADQAAGQAPTEVIENVAGGASEQQELKMSDEGLGAVRDIHLARMALNDGYTDQAKKLLTEAQGLLGKVKKLDSPVTVSTQVEVGGKVVRSEKNVVTPDLIPIASELQVIEDFSAQPAKAEAVKKAKEHLANDRRQDAIDELKVAEVGLISQDVSMPLSETAGWVKTALELLDSGKLHEANLELKKVSDGLVRETTVLVQPTVAAADQAQGAPKTAEAKASN